jgi:hypothetical protein
MVIFTTAYADEAGFIFVKADYKIIKIKIFLINDKSVMTLLSLKAIEERLPPDMIY